MDKEQEELQFLGFFGIFKESFKIIFSWRKIFSQITLALILPLSFFFLAHIQISRVLFAKIVHHDEDALDRTYQVDTPNNDKLSDIFSSEWTAFWLVKVAYSTFLVILSLVPTSAVVYTIAYTYTAKEITFKKVMSVVPKVWKRLMVTSIWAFAIFLCYNIIAAQVLVAWYILIGANTIGTVVFIVLLILYLMGLVYISVVWRLASVVSVLEDVYGIQAMIKSKDLIEGKKGVAIAIFLMLNLCLIIIQLSFERVVVLVESPSTANIRTWFGILSFLLILKLILDLFGLVVETVIYFVCKSYHHENIDKSSLADHLEVYVGDYVPLNGKDVQFDQFYV